MKTMTALRSAAVPKQRASAGKTAGSEDEFGELKPASKPAAKKTVKDKAPAKVGRSRVLAEKLASPGASPKMRGAADRAGFKFIEMGSGVQAHDVLVAGVPGRALGYIVGALDAVPRKTVLDAIGVSERTAHRIKANPDKPLDAKTSDAIFRLESIRASAQEILGSIEAAIEWLNTEAVGLEFRKPIELMSTSPGAEAVKTLLQRMKYGVYA